MEALDLKILKQRADLVFAMEGHLLLISPGVAQPKELTGEASAGSHRLADICPEMFKVFGWTKRETKAGVDEIRRRQTDFLKPSDLRL